MLAIAALGDSGGPQNATHLQNNTILDSRVSCHIAGAQGDAVCSGLGASGAGAGGALMLLVQVLEPVPTTFLPFLASLHGLGPCLALSAGCTKTIKWYVSFGMSLPVVAPRES